MAVRPGRSAPRYQQIAGDLRRAIATGRYKPGGLLPSQSALEKDFRAAGGTIVSALEVLRKEGLIETSQGKGSKVLEPGTAGIGDDWRAALVRDVEDLKADVEDLKAEVMNLKAVNGLPQSGSESLREAR